MAEAKALMAKVKGLMADVKGLMADAKALVADVKVLVADVKALVADVKALMGREWGLGWWLRPRIRRKEGNKRRGIRRKYPGEGRSDGREQVARIRRKGASGCDPTEGNKGKGIRRKLK